MMFSFYGQLLHPLHLQPWQVCFPQGFGPLHLHPLQPTCLHLHRNRPLVLPEVRSLLQHLRPHTILSSLSFRTPTRDRTEDTRIKSPLLCR